MSERAAREPLARLAELEETVAALRGTVRAQEGRLARHEGRARRRGAARRLLPLALAALLVALVPLATLAANPFFSDLGEAAAVHRGDIQAIGNAGITTGFENPDDPTARLYNPTGLVTRQEMASFLARTAGLGGNPPVANALTAQTAGSAQTAASAATLDGRAPNALLRAAQVRNYNAMIPLGATSVRIITVTIDLPAPGFVLVNGGVQLTSSSGTLTQVDTLLVDETDNAVSPYATILLPPAPSAQYINPTFIFTATAGRHTYALQATGRAGIVVTASGPILSAVYIPFGYNGGATLAP